MSNRRKYKQPSRNYPIKSKNDSFLWIIALILLSGYLATQNHLPKPYAMVISPPGDLFPKVTPFPPSEKETIPQNLTVGSGQSLNRIDFTRIDQSARALNYQGTSISELAALLSRQANSEAEKARIIYSWLAYHIAYDVQGFVSGNYGDLSPVGVLTSRKAVCSGYANLYEALARHMDLEAFIVEGYAKGVSYATGQEAKVNHAWNSVKIDNQWYLVDATWGAGTVDNQQFNPQFNPHYFATPPEQFIYDHLPVKEQWQLLSQPYSKNQFESLPNISAQFFKSGLSTSNYTSNTINTQGQAQIILNAPANVFASARLISLDRNQYLEDGYTLVQKEQGKIIVNTSFPNPGAYELRIFVKDDSQKNYSNHAITYRINATESGQKFPKSFSTFSDTNTYLHSPLINQLSTGQVVKFALQVPNAIDVQVIDTSSNSWTKLNKVDGYFTGDVPVNSSKIHVSAKFSGNDKYWTLLEYNN